MAKFNLKDQLAGIAALIAAIVAIGGGFVKYGEIMTKLDVLSEQTGPNLLPLTRQIGEVKKGVMNNQKTITINTEDMLENAGEIKVLQKERNLTVKGKIESKTDENEEHFVHHGIANRSFDRTFRLGPHVLVRNATLKNGMLAIDLEQELPEEEKPKEIPITVN